MQLLKIIVIITILLPGLIVGCNTANKSGQAKNDSLQASIMIPNPKAFQQKVNGKQVNLFILKNKNGMEAAITNYGGRVVSILARDSSGQLKDVALGYKNLEGYLNDGKTYFGALIGRYGNRIANGKFSLDGVTYSLFINNAPNSLHGGKRGFDAVVWDAMQPDSQHLNLSYLSKDMEEGYPGNLTVKVKYTLTNNNELKIDYTATTDKNTVLNLTNHTYYNLSGEGSPTILDHIIMINAHYFTPTDSTSIPTGKIEPVKGTPFDFTTPIAIGARINEDNQQLKYGHGYDHNFVLDKLSSDELSLAADVYSPVTKIEMKVYTTEPGVQFYTGNFLDGSNVGKSGKAYQRRSAFCLETQHFPDSPNHPEFPSTELKPGDTFTSQTIYRFGVKK